MVEPFFNRSNLALKAIPDQELLKPFCDRGGEMGGGERVSAKLRLAGKKNVFLNTFTLPKYPLNSKFITSLFCQILC